MIGLDTGFFVEILENQKMAVQVWSELMIVPTLQRGNAALTLQRPQFTETPHGENALRDPGKPPALRGPGPPTGQVRKQLQVLYGCPAYRAAGGVSGCWLACDSRNGRTSETGNTSSGRKAPMRR